MIAGTAHPQLNVYKLDKRVMAFSSTRKGGISKNNYGEFNINPYCGDSMEAVASNRSALCDMLGVDDEHLVLPHQTHGTEIRKIDGCYFSLTEKGRQDFLYGVDALMTDIPHLCIGVSTADCIPILLYDPEHNACCAVHAGWRGTVARIVVKAVARMKEVWGTSAETLQAIVGPGISLKNFEVGDEVYNEFVDAGFDMSVIAERRSKWHIDLPHCNELQLMTAGLKASNIQNTGICTYDSVDLYFSARRLGIQSGRIFSGIMIL